MTIDVVDAESGPMERTGLLASATLTLIRDADGVRLEPTEVFVQLTQGENRNPG